MMSSRRLVLWLSATLAFGALTGCYPGYRMDVEQGNLVTPEQSAQLQLGMSRREARFVPGLPTGQRSISRRPLGLCLQHARWCDGHR